MNINVNLVVLPADLCEKLADLVNNAQSNAARGGPDADIARRQLSEACGLVGKLRNAAQPLVVTLAVGLEVAP